MPPPKLIALMLAAFVSVMLASAVMSLDLPAAAPQPDRRPATADAPKSETGQPEDRPRTESVGRSDEPPVPEARPDSPSRSGSGSVDRAAPSDAPKPAPEPPAIGAAIPRDARSQATRAAAMPQDEILCRQRLRSLGARFEERPGEFDAAGCALPWPIAVSGLGGGLGMEPQALTNCALAEALAKFGSAVVQPQARQSFSMPVETIEQASGYACRTRNGQEKLSEHAFGNALDVAAFILADGRRVAVNGSGDEKALSFLAALRKSACGPFKTVLGPGSDSDHADHFHLDLAPRRNGATFCE